MAETINLKLKIWRQKNHSDRGTFELYDMPGVSTHMSFLEMMDVLNDRLIREGKDRSRSTTIAAKASAACARCTSTAVHTDR